MISSRGYALGELPLDLTASPAGLRHGNLYRDAFRSEMRGNLQVPSIIILVACQEERFIPGCLHVVTRCQLPNEQVVVQMSALENPSGAFVAA